jgi:hypothetical protein
MNGFVKTAIAPDLEWHFLQLIKTVNTPVTVTMFHRFPALASAIELQ